DVALIRALDVIVAGTGIDRPAGRAIVVLERNGISFRSAVHGSVTIEVDAVIRQRIEIVGIRSDERYREPGREGADIVGAVRGGRGEAEAAVVQRGRRERENPRL